MTTVMQQNPGTAATAHPNVKHYGADDVRRLKELVKEGCVVLQEIDDLKEGLSDTVKAIAEEIDVKPSQLNKVIKIAHKRSLQDERDAFEEIEDILETIGRGI